MFTCGACYFGLWPRPCIRHLGRPVVVRSTAGLGCRGRIQPSVAERGAALRDRINDGPYRATTAGMSRLPVGPVKTFKASPMAPKMGS